MDGLTETSYEAYYQAMTFVGDHERMPKENIPMTLQQSESIENSKTLHEQILEVFAEEEHRFDGWAEAERRGVKSTVGGIPAAYADDEPQLNFVRRRGSLRQRAEDRLVQ